MFDGFLNGQLIIIFSFVKKMYVWIRRRLVKSKQNDFSIYKIVAFQIFIIADYFIHLRELIEALLSHIFI